jgi:hypothetical protein
MHERQERMYRTQYKTYARETAVRFGRLAVRPYDEWLEAALTPRWANA